MATLRSCLRSSREIDGGHAAGPEFAFDRVAVGEGRRKPIVRHGFPKRAASSLVQLSVTTSCR